MAEPKRPRGRPRDTHKLALVSGIVEAAEATASITRWEEQYTRIVWTQAQLQDEALVRRVYAGQLDEVRTVPGDTVRVTGIGDGQKQLNAVTKLLAEQGVEEAEVAKVVAAIAAHQKKHTLTRPGAGARAKRARALFRQIHDEVDRALVDPDFILDLNALLRRRRHREAGRPRGERAERPSIKLVENVLRCLGDATSFAGVTKMLQRAKRQIR